MGGPGTSDRGPGTCPILVHVWVGNWKYSINYNVM